ncbi:hypothetical protein NDU88_000208 [Pleurodeles waltl]|uniref:Uncharacterized protein n=1 Tax=Pleurodeles waltl TaxID=8319 RepID=A0AAV7TGH9_PLEWA|nr:hypothetical protein NDU88_000208 [Pleurodeles waltl]
MERDDKVREVLALLWQAGRMDLVKEEALAPSRLALSARLVLPRRSRLALRRVRRVEFRVGVPSEFEKKENWVGAQRFEDSRVAAAGWVEGEGPQVESAGFGAQRDPRVPVSRKWPTMLIWSSSEEEGVPGDGEGEWSDGEGPSAGGTRKAPRRVYGSLQLGTLLGEDEGSEEGEVLGKEGGIVVQGKKGVFLYPGTPDLVWQGPLDFDEEDPGQQEAARTPWEEGKAGPRAASRMASSGWRGRRREAADASSGRCGGVGYAPPDATAWEEQRPGPSKRRSKNTGEYTDCV